MAKEVTNTVNYTEDNIKTLEWNEHIRRRAGMYVGRLGNGDDQGDGIYVLLKEVVDNSIDEFAMGFGKQIQITIEGKEVTVRDISISRNSRLIASYCKPARRSIAYARAEARLLTSLSKAMAGSA